MTGRARRLRRTLRRWERKQARAGVATPEPSPALTAAAEAFANLGAAITELSAKLNAATMEAFRRWQGRRRFESRGLL